MEGNERQSGKIEGAFIVLILLAIGFMIYRDPVNQEKNGTQSVSDSWPMSQQEFLATQKKRR